MNKIDLQGKNAVITGGARGIGFAIAQRLLASGARCSLWDLDGQGLVVAAKAVGGPDIAHTATVNVSQPDSVQAAADQTFKQFGSVDILVNNAGIAGATKKTWELTPAEWQEVLQVNLFGVFLCARAIVPRMIEKGYGRIVNIASIAGKEGNPNASHYSAAKAGVIAFTKSLAKETAKSGLMVNCITPAVIETDILKQTTQQHI